VDCFSAGRDSRLVVDAIVVGYLSHLVADLLTSRGLRLMWPSRLHFAIPLCKAGSMTEWIIVACAVAFGTHTMGWALIPRL
jgi:inner membrane protein